MFRILLNNLEELSPIEFVEEYNRQMGTGLIIDDIEWDGIGDAKETN